MSRYFMIQSWVGSHENEPDYNGQQCGERNVRSIEAVPLYDQFGNANVSAFSDEAIAARNNTKKSSTVSIKDKILPQAKRLTTLREQMVELENSYRSGEMSISEYSLYRDIIVAKIQRQEVLYKRAASVKPKSAETDEFNAEYYSENDDHPQPNDSHTPEAFAWIRDENSLKKTLQGACSLVRKVVQFYYTIKMFYYNTRI